MELLSIGEIALVPVIIGIIQALKMGDVLPNKLAPVFSLLLGIVIASLSAKGMSFEVVLSGIVMGLSASGLYSGTKSYMVQ